MKILIEKKITIDPEDSELEPVIAYDDIVEAGSQDANAVLGMIEVGIEAMELESNKAMSIKVSEIVRLLKEGA